MNRIQIDSTRSKSKITVPGKRTTTKTTNAISEESAIDLEVQIRCRALRTLRSARARGWPSSKGSEGNSSWR